MCNHCSEDPRDGLHGGALALAGLRDLVGDVRQGGGGFDQVGPAELGELLDMVTRRIERAADQLQDYVPRGFTPPAE